MEKQQARRKSGVSQLRWEDCVKGVLERRRGCENGENGQLLRSSGNDNDQSSASVQERGDLTGNHFMKNNLLRANIHQCVHVQIRLDSYC